MLKLTIATLGVCFLSACGGSSSTPAVITAPDETGSEYPTVLPSTGLTGTFSFYGYLDIIDDTVDDRINRDANYLEMVVSQDASVFVNSVPPAIDSCKLQITSTIPTDVGVIGFPDAQFNLVSAGESFTLTSSSGTYATVSYADDRFDIAPYPIPESLTLDIPGETFPAFSGITVPTAVSVQSFSPSRNQPLGADTPITWDASGIPEHTIYLRVFDIVESDKIVNLYCAMADDGNFTLPTNIVTALNASLGAGFALDGTMQDVVSVNVVTQGDALLVVSKRLQFLF